MNTTTPIQVVLLALGLAGCGRKEAPAPASSTNEAAAANPITAPVDYLGAVGNAQKQSLKVVDTVQVQQAVRQFQAAEDRYPATLDELVREGYLVALPKLPAGMKYQYDAAKGTVKAVAGP